MMLASTLGTIILLSLSVRKLAAKAACSAIDSLITLRDRRIIVPNVEANIKKIIRRLQNSEDSVRQTTLNYIRAGYDKMRGEGHIFPYRPDMLNERVDFITIDVSELVGGYGGVHCAIAAIRRV